MKKFVFTAVVVSISVGLLAACAVDRTAINATEIALTAAEKAAKIYVQLPLCPQPTGKLCSVVATSDAIKAADNVAYDSVVGMRSGKITVEAASADIAKLVTLIPVK